VDITKQATPLRVGGTYGLAASILSSLLAIFKSRYPDVEVVLRSNEAGILKQMILKGHLEIALTSVAPRSPELMAEFCLPLKLVAFAAKGYPIAQEKQLSLADLEKIPLIIRDDGSKHGTTNIVAKTSKLGTPTKHRYALRVAGSDQDGGQQEVVILYQDVLKDTKARGLFKRLRLSGLPPAFAQRRGLFETPERMVRGQKNQDKTQAKRSCGFPLFLTIRS
jgi:hypothetical protein